MDDVRGGRRGTLWWRVLGVVAIASSATTGYAQHVASTRTQTTGAAQAVAKGRADVPPLERRVTLELQDVPLPAALRMIDQQVDLGLAFTNAVVPTKKRISLSMKGMRASEALRRVLEGTGVVVQVTASGQVVLVKRAGDEKSSAADDTVKVGMVGGRVVDSTTSRPLAGAVISIRGTPLTSTTNDSGYYWILNVPVGVRVVTARHLGYAGAEKEIVLGDGRQAVRVDFALRMGMSRLQEVVTTATGKRRRLEVANDITMIDVDSVMRTAPIRNVADLLETRVPGLIVQHTSGAPGDPVRLRLRGASSVYGSNDPIVIVDGIRVYAAQSDPRSANLGGSLGRSGDGEFYTAATPSPLDQIDPNSIETIEVLKGPSAATFYGADAANGVIVITTKRGRPGPARWRVTASRGLSYLPGRYPDAYYRWGHIASDPGSPVLCPITGLAYNSGCMADSLVRFQALNARDLTPLGHGGSTRLSLGIDGGTRELAYSLTGSYDDETGILELPSRSAERFEALHGYSAPEWMRRPQTLRRWGGTARLTAQLGRQADAAVTATLSRQTQQRSSLEQQLAALMTSYVDRASKTIYQVPGAAGSPIIVGELVPDFYRRATDVATSFTNAASFNWRPRSWLTTSADAGLNLVTRQDAVLLPPNVLPNVLGVLDTVGSLSTGRGSSLVSTVNIRALATAPLPLGLRFQLATGANYTKTAINDLMASATGLAEGTTSLNGASTWGAPAARVSDVATYGWYVEPSLAHKRFFLNAGLRFDGGSTYGSHVSLPTFPKIGGSWLISGEPWFPFKEVFNTLRLRAAYGHAGVQPGISDRLRLYRAYQPWVDGGFGAATDIEALGNTKLRPERSTEIEAGFDADLLDDRASVSVSRYRKIRKDALLRVPVAPSVYGPGVSVWKNIGVIRNTGLEISVRAQLVRSDPVSWSTTLSVSRNENVVESLAPGMQPFMVDKGSRVAPGYPLFGRWAKPIKGYADIDGDGVIETREVQLGDTLVFMGEAMPNYDATLHTTLSLLRGAVTVNAGFDYQDGLTQVNKTAKRSMVLSRGMNDPSAPFSEQAAVAVMGVTDYGLMQDVNTLRFNSLSIAFNAPPSLARHIGASAFSIALQGSNLALITNYAGKDPNVNAYATGNGVLDTGMLPQPRMWLLGFTVRY